jgi:hypothetical protein
VESPSYRGLTPDDLFEIADRRGIHFDRASQTGVVFHMMSALGTRGQTGLTAVANGPEGAESLYERTVSILDEETSGAYRPDA